MKQMLVDAKTFRADVLPNIKAAHEIQGLQDLDVVCGSGPSVRTSSMLVAAISPWVRGLLEGAGEGAALTIPSLTADMFTTYLSTCLSPAQGVLSDEALEVHELVQHQRWAHRKVEKATIKPEVKLEAEESEEGAEDAFTKAAEYLKLKGYDSKEEEDDFEDPAFSSNDEISDDDWEDGEVTRRKKKTKSEQSPKKHKKYWPVKRKKSGPKPKNIMPEDGLCAECGAEFQSWSGYSLHLIIHQVENFTCDCPNVPKLENRQPGQLVGQEFREKERHMKVHHMGWLPCDSCVFAFEDESKLEKHMKTHVSNEICDQCGFKANAKTSSARLQIYERHMMRHTVTDFSCDCPDAPVFREREDAERVGLDFKKKERHMKVEHMGWFGCEKCLFCYKTLAQLEKHVSTHHMSIICDLCGWEASNPNNLKHHKKAYHEERPEPCPECGKRFPGKSALRKHIGQSHQPAQTCMLCGKQVKNLKLHMKITHTEDKDKPFQCEDCGKGFPDKAMLECHRMNMHIKSTPYQCRYGCDNRYNDKSNRNAHEKRRHGGTFK